jgi:hypothetical protein
MKTITSFSFLIMMSFSLMAQGPVTLKLNLQKGKTYRISQSNTQNVQQTVNGQQYSSDVLSSIAATFKVLSQENDIMHIAFRFDTIATKVSSAMNKKETNSARVTSKSDPMERILNKLSSLTIVAKISTAGKFIGFANYPTFKDSAMFVLDSIPVTKRDKAKQQAENIFKESNLQSMIEPYFSYLPEKAVNVNDTWESSYVMSADRTSMMSFNTYTLKAIDGNLTQITGSSEIESIPSNDPTASQTKLKGTSNSDISANITSGLLSKNTSKGHVAGTVNYNQQGKTMEVLINVDSQSTIVIQ